MGIQFRLPNSGCLNLRILRPRDRSHRPAGAEHPADFPQSHDWVIQVEKHESHNGDINRAVTKP